MEKLKKLESFFQRRIPVKNEINPLKRQGRFLHDTLLDKTFNIPSADIKRRRASMCIDGTPIVYSLKITRRLEHPSFRMLVEPGGVGITILEQINWASQTLDIILHRLDWESTVEDIKAIINCIFPGDINTIMNLWGGMWLGMDLNNEKLELRLYLNLRYGDALTRWQRIADLFSWFGDESLTEPFKMFVGKVALHAIPVGLGVVVSKRIRGFQIYVGMHAPEYKSIIAAFPQHITFPNVDFESFCRSFIDQFGSFVQQSVTLGFGFGLKEDGHLHPEITRVKVDISCQFIDNTSLHLESFLNSFLLKNNVNTLPLEMYYEDLRECFGGWDTEYISLGFNDGLDHFTVYTKPHGYKQK